MVHHATMNRRLVFPFSWLLVTVMATGLVWAGVQVVAGRVVEPLTPLTATAAPSAPVPTSSPPSARPTPSVRPTPTAAAVETRSYDLVGGTVTVQFSPSRVKVVTASPKDGFVLRPVEHEGPLEVAVEFRHTDDTWRSRLRATWDDGPAERIEERDRR